MSHEERITKLEDNSVEIRTTLAEIKTLLNNHLAHHEAAFTVWSKLYLPIILFLGNVLITAFTHFLGR